MTHDTPASKSASDAAIKQFTNDLIAYARDSALKNHVITASALADLEKVNFDGYRPGDKNSAAQLTDAMRSAHPLMQERQEDGVQASRYIASERIVLNALGNMLRASKTPTPYERFKAYFEAGLSGDDASRNTFIHTLEEAKEKMLVSIIYTMHPTIYHTQFAREQEKALTQTLEALADRVKSPQSAGDMKTSAILLNEAKAAIDGIMEGVAKGNVLTPKDKVKVAEENQLDRANHEALKEQFNQVKEDFDRALVDVVRAKIASGELKDGQPSQLQNLKIDPKVEYRTWASSADVDGRPSSTGYALYEGIYSHDKKDEKKNDNGTKFIGRKRDARENAKDHENCISCLIERAYNNGGDFRRFCEKFGQDHKAGTILNDETVVHPGQTPLQLFQEKEKTEFLKALITDGHPLVPGRIAAEALAFNEMFLKAYPEFLERENALRAEHKKPPLSPDTELESLARIDGAGPQDAKLFLKLKDYISRLDTNRYLSPKTLKAAQREGLHYEINEDGTYEARPYTDTSEFFRGLHKPVITEKQVDGVVATGKNGQPVKAVDVPQELTPEERRKLLDVVKRLQIMDAAVAKYGNDVSDRYQIANFSNPSDFYAALLLFKEAGLVKIKDGKVVKEFKDGKPVSPKLSIVPLLETQDDQRKAPQMFAELLKDPLAKSYYEALGRADVMVGYSDGAKSAGNFASEWSIRQCTEKLAKIFDEAFPDEHHRIPLQVVHGRGRGDSRGGQFEEGQSQRMMAPSLQRKMIYSTTLQSDLPLHAATSPSFGKDMLAGILTGILTAKQESEALKADENLSGRIARLDPLIDKIADASMHKYCELVTDKPNVAQTMKLLDIVHDNANKASRPASRSAGKFEDVRAITFEYRPQMVDAPLHYCGLHTALDEFIGSGTAIAVASKDGKSEDTYRGKKALEALYDTHPFFHDMLDKTARGLINYDPNVFRQYAKIGGKPLQDWAEKCILELDGTRELVEDIRHRRATRESIEGRKFSDQSPEEKAERLASLKQRVHKGERASSDKWSSIKQSVVQQYKSTKLYNENAEDPLRDREVKLKHTANALALAMMIDCKGAVQTQDAVIKQRHYDPFHPDSRNASDAAQETLRNLVFVAAGISGSLPPASIRAAVDHAPYRER